jgi:hypothetical protein
MPSQELHIHTILSKEEREALDEIYYVESMEHKISSMGRKIYALTLENNRLQNALIEKQLSEDEIKERLELQHGPLWAVNGDKE